ncbi:MAG TPA: class I SAM-dependent methyltransferase [Bacteroidales bacterium]|nr:class I SAM-dependent methyltransferase [Bacteroidales bacterium]
MQYEPIKRSLGRVFRKSILLKKLLYLLLDLLLLRSWHVRKAIGRTSSLLPSDARVLDAGSGFGQYTWRMSSRHRGWNIKGIDINDEEVAECNEFFRKTGRSGRVAFFAGDLTKLDETGLYDLVLTVDVMEHITEDEKVFSNFSKALKPGGKLIISTPSDMGGSDVHDHDDTSFIDEHVRDGYGKEEIISKLEKAGFSKVDVAYTYGRAGSISWRISMKYPVKMLNSSYFFFILLPFWYIIAFPVALVLNFIDVNVVNKSGTGLLVTAEKIQ